MQPFNDGAHIIYVNGANTDDTLLGKLMQDFKQNDPSKIHAKILADRMKIIKSNSEEDADMCKLMEDLIKDCSAAMVKDAEANGKINAIRNLVLKGLVNINDLKKSGDYTPEELAAISQ